MIPIVYQYIHSFYLVLGLLRYLVSFSVFAYLYVLACLSVLAYFSNLACLGVLAYFTNLACLSVLIYFSNLVCLSVLVYFSNLACLSVLGVSRKLRPRKLRPQTSDLENVDSSLLVRLHRSIQNSSCTFNVPMFLLGTLRYLVSFSVFAYL